VLECEQLYTDVHCHGGALHWISAFLASCSEWPHAVFFFGWRGFANTVLMLLWPSARRTKHLLKLNRNQLRWVVGLLRGHCHLKRHLFKLGLTDDSIFERCLEEAISAMYILCDCEAVAYLRFYHLGQFFMEPSDYYDAPLYKVVHFIEGVGLIKG
jgi:hypothetical protein